MTDNRKEQERAELHHTIWNIANDLRGSVDGWDFKEYVLEMLFYRYISENITAYINAAIKNETIWLTQKVMAEFLGVQTPAIGKHLKNIFEEGELDEKVVISKMEITTTHGAIPGKTQTRNTRFYNLDAIISVGYRVNPKRATSFRIWATRVLKEYMTKGFTLDDERLKHREDRAMLGNNSSAWRDSAKMVWEKASTGCFSPFLQN